MFRTREVGSLAVVEETASKQQIDRDLKRFDPNLFLDAEIDTRQRFVWSVKEHIGSEHPPHLVFEWRDEAGEPLPLTSGLLEEVRKIGWRRAHGITAFDVAREANDKRRQEQMRKSAAEYEDIAEELRKAMNSMHAACLPRSQSLRMMRDKKRAQGFKI